MRTLLRLWCAIATPNHLLWRCRGVGKSSTVAMYGATKLYAILAMRVRCTSPPPQITCPPATQAQAIYCPGGSWPFTCAAPQAERWTAG